MPKAAPFRFLAGLAWCYLVALAVVALVVLFVGERWWLGTMLLYVPRLPLLLPLLACAPLAFRRPRRVVFAIQSAVAVAVVLLLSGPHVSFVRASGGPTVRVFSHNVWYGHGGLEPIEREVDAAGAGIVLLQAMQPEVGRRLRGHLGTTEWTFHSTPEFFLATRYKVVSVERERDYDLYVHYTLETPLGLLDVFNTHPYSPRTGIFGLRSQSKKDLLTGGPSDEAVETVERNTQQRESQVTALAAAAAVAKNPVVIAGDTNLPEWSALYRRHLAKWQDGFARAGTGFGYTFPAHHVSWMRIDRVLAGPELRFTSFGVGARAGSDHAPVWADLEKR